MCGIIGIWKKHPFDQGTILEKLSTMEYRGYDSFGIFDGKEVYKEKGRIKDFLEQKKKEKQTTSVAIGHTRWATHGPATKENAHPHKAKEVILVHNGIIENYQMLKEEVEKKGAKLLSQTDSEVVAWFIQTLREEGKDMQEILHILTKKLTGTYAFAIMIEGEEKIYFAKKDSPLLLGIGEEEIILASDGIVFNESILRVAYLEDGEYGEITSQGYAVFYEEKKVTKEEKENPYVNEEEHLEGYSSFLHKEICEIPKKAQELLQSLGTQQQKEFQKIQALLRSRKKVLFVACGTASYAASLGAQALREEGIRAKECIASEFEEAFIEKETLVIAISQSGETMDVIEVLKCAKKKGATIIAITNTAFSTIERLADESLRIVAGREIAVASSKAFSNQAITLFSLAGKNVEKIPQELEKNIALEKNIEILAKDILQSSPTSIYLLGAKNAFSIAQEIALKIKEVSYIHAEAMRAGEFKHGTLALIEQDVPVLGLSFLDEERVEASLEEARARGAQIITFGKKQKSSIYLEASTKESLLLCAGMLGQLLGYYLGMQKGLDVDRPRNLAKSVTVH